MSSTSRQFNKNSLFNKWFCGNWTATFKRMNLDCSLTPNTKINEKWVTGLNVRAKTMKLLQKIVNIHNHRSCNDFLNIKPSKPVTKEKIGKYIS